MAVPLVPRPFVLALVEERAAIEESRQRVVAGKLAQPAGHRRELRKHLLVTPAQRVHLIREIARCGDLPAEPGDERLLQAVETVRSRKQPLAAAVHHVEIEGDARVALQRQGLRQPGGRGFLERARELHPGLYQGNDGPEPGARTHDFHVPVEYDEEIRATLDEL